MICPCGKQIEYEDCCGRFINTSAFAPDPETLMRSRYTAFVLCKVDYLKQTMQGKALKRFKFTGLDAWLKEIKWLSLNVIQCAMKSKGRGYVTFKATYIEKGLSVIIHEKSEFEKIAGRWYYVNGRPMS